MYIIYGGKSEIACAISKKMSEYSEVLHITREVTDDLIQNFSQFKNIELVEIDLDNTSQNIEFVKTIMQQKNLEGIVFAHRYRGIENNAAKQFNIEVNTPFEIIQCLSKNATQKSVSVVLFSSPAAKFVVMDQDFLYHASKASINALIRFSALRFANSNLRINGVSPSSFVLKDRNKNFYQANPDLFKRIEKFIPISEISTPGKIVNIVEFLLSKEACSLNGVIIEMDGGYLNQEPSNLIR